MLRIGSAFLCSCLALVGCSSSGDDGGPVGGGGPTVAGSAVKGTLVGATVAVFATDDNGVKLCKLGEGQTDQNGVFRFEIQNFTGFVLLCSTGGSYVDEATGTNVQVPAGKELSGVAFVQSGTVVDHRITPLTTMLVCLIEEFARDADTSFQDAFENALRVMETVFGIPDIHLLAPADLTAGPVQAGDAANYGAVLAGLAEYAVFLGTDAVQLACAAAQDIKDCVWDGMRFGNVIDVPGAGPFPPDFVTNLGAFMTMWLDTPNPNNNSGLGSTDITNLSTIQSAGPSVPKPPRITSVWDAYSPLAGGNTVRVRGVDFGTSPRVVINGIEQTIDSSTNTQIEFTTSTQSQTGTFDMEFFGNVDTFRKVRLMFRVYDPSIPPTIDGINVDEGPVIGGTGVVIQGSGFDQNSQVLFGGAPALVRGGPFPNKIAVISPESISGAGTVDIRVENDSGQGETIPNAFTYKNKSAGSGFDESDFANETHHSVYTQWTFPNGEPTIRAGISTKDLDGSGQGTYSDTFSTNDRNGKVDGTSAGTLFYSADGVQYSDLEVDGQTQQTRFTAGVASAKNRSVISGLGAGLQFDQFRSTTGATNALLTGDYHVIATKVEFNPLSHWNFAGPMVFDGTGKASANTRCFQRDGQGPGFSTNSWSGYFDYTIDGSGGLTLTLDPEGDDPWTFFGRVSPEGHYAKAYYSGDVGVMTLLILRAGRGCDNEAVQDAEFAGGFASRFTVERQIQGNGHRTDATVELARFLANVGFPGTDELRVFASKDGVLKGEDDPVGTDFQDARLLDIALAPAGGLHYGEEDDFATAGYFNHDAGMAIIGGRVPFLAQDTGEFDDLMTQGSVNWVPSLYTKWSLNNVDFNILNIKSYFLNFEDPPTGDGVTESRIGVTSFRTDVDDSFGFDPFGVVSQSPLFLKDTIRTNLQVNFGSRTEPDFLEDEILFLFQLGNFQLIFGDVDPSSPLANFPPLFVEGLGRLGADGSWLVFGPNVKSSTTTFTFGSPVVEGPIETDGIYDAIELSFDYDAQGVGHVAAAKGSYTISMDAITGSLQDRSRAEDTSDTTGSLARSGTVVERPGGFVDLNFDALGNDPARTYGGLQLGPAWVFLDFTSNARHAIQVLVPRGSGTPPVQDRYTFLQFDFDYVDMNFPAERRLDSTFGDLNLNNSISLNGNRFTDSNVTPGKVQARQFQVATVAFGAGGGTTLQIGNETENGSATQDGCFFFATEDGVGPPLEYRITLGLAR